MFRSHFSRAIVFLVFLPAQFFLTGIVWGRSPLIVLYSVGSETRLLEGTAADSNRPACPASTFKILIALAALEEGIASPGRLILCSDPHIASSPRHLDLHHAMVLSSNAYFRGLVVELGRNRLEQWVEKSGILEKPLDRSWIGKDLSAAVHGGKILVTPRALHRLMQNIAGFGVGTRPDVRESLVSVLEWPSPDPSVRLYGKTGVYGGAVWFTGFGDRNGKRTIVTVFQHGTIADRPAVIARFYQAFGVFWKPSLLEGW